MKVLITGVAGFIGMHLAQKLLNLDIEVIGIDILNDYYDEKLKISRLELLNQYKKFTFIKEDICEYESLLNAVKESKPSDIIHLAGQPGVRYSTDNPQAVMDGNIRGFLNILECCRSFSVKHFIFASSSSVYGLTSEPSLAESQTTDTPASFYAASKKCNEIMAYSYSNLFQIPTTALRLFTVYGPWGRPDMAYHSFTRSILHKEQIAVFNSGNMLRDFTYIDDVTESIYRILKKPPNESDKPPFNIFNIGNSKPISLMDFIITLEEVIGAKAEKLLLPMPKGDIKFTKANSEKLEAYISFTPSTEIKDGLEKFYSWYKSYYNY